MEGTALSLSAPFSYWWAMSPGAASVGISSMAYGYFRKPALRWYVIFVALCMVLLSLEARIFGIPNGGAHQRLIVIFSLLVAPFVAYAACSLASDRVRRPAIAAAVAVTAVLIVGKMPSPRGSSFWTLRPAFSMARVFHEAERDGGVRARVLCLRSEDSTDSTDLMFWFAAFDRFQAVDPSRFPSPRALRTLLDDSRIGWVVTSEPDAAALLPPAARHVGTLDHTALFAYRLPQSSVTDLRRRLLAVPPNSWIPLDQIEESRRRFKWGIQRRRVAVSSPAAIRRKAKSSPASSQ
jgi:hypothetical protein